MPRMSMVGAWIRVRMTCCDSHVMVVSSLIRAVKAIVGSLLSQALWPSTGTEGISIQDFYFEEVRVFQAGIRLEYISME